jgi:hypothetical protein
MDRVGQSQHRGSVITKRCRHQTADGDPDDTVPEGSAGIAAGTVLPTPAHAFAGLAIRF